MRNRHIFRLLFLGKVLLLLALLGWSNFSIAQTAYSIQFSTNGVSDSLFLRKLDVPTRFNNLNEAKATLNQILGEARQSGYLSASFDSVKYDSTQITADFHLGNRYKWTRLRTSKTVDDWLSEVGLFPESFQNEVLDPVAFNRLTTRLLEYGENHGYPFVNIRLDSVSIKKDSVEAVLLLDKNRFFQFDTVSINGNARLSKNFLYQYLGFKPGDVYSERLIRKLDSRLSKLPYTSQTSKPKVYFVGNRVRIAVYLDHRKTDRVDGIIGFAPNSSTDNSLLITGEVNIDLKNLLRRGIGYTLHWKSFAQQSQQLKMGAQLPFLFRSPIGVDGQFEYVKFDTQFFTLRTALGVKYLFEGTDFFKIYVQNHQSALIFTDTSEVRQTKSIPTSNPVRSLSYGIQVLKQTLDVPYNPRRGLRLELDANVGRRTIQKDIRIEQVLFTDSENNTYTVYDSANLKTTQAELRYDLAYFFPIGKKSTIVPSISGKQLISETIFSNDLYRFGGSRSLRGFNEESIQANSFTMFTLEYRYILGGNAFFQLFANAAYLENKSDLQNGLRTDTPYGFGAGVHLEVNTGILSLAYALGSEQGNPIKFSLAKIHFGIINYL
ncbi:MAG: hypothetical protein JJ975_13720 [Bacteroidia bacterium]|nr:hypothetical protein [Bacteroidia bacterium]